MDKRKFAGGGNRSDGHRLNVALLWLLSATAAILLNFQTIAYAADDSAGGSHQERSLVVRNWKGDYLGTSSHVVLDPSAGMIAFVIVALETGQNKGIKEIAVPWGLFSVDKENGVLVLNISKKELESAPEYHVSDLADPEFVGRIYRFFALGPPRTKKSPQEKRMSLEGFEVRPFRPAVDL